MKKGIFPYIVFLAALALAGTAAFFSVTGLSKLFAGSEVAVIVMASALEFAKIVTASFIHRYWKTIKWYMRAYLTAGVMTVMVITSAGIYGFLSNAYSLTSTKMGVNQSQVDNLTNKKTIIQNEIAAFNQSKDLKTQRIKTLTGLRAQQETIMDSLYQRRQLSSAKRMQAEIEKSGQDIDKLNIESDSIDAKIQRKYIESSSIDTTISSLQNNSTVAEVGPLKYIAKLTGKSMDQVANFFIMLLIFVFDPLAISLVIAANIAFEKRNLVEIEYTEPVEKTKPIKEKAFNMINKVGGLLKRKKKEEISEELEKKVEAKKEPIEEKKVAEEETKSGDENDVAAYIADEKGEFRQVTEVKEEPKKEEAEIKPVEEIKPAPAIKESTESLFKTLNVSNSNNYLNLLEVLYDGGKRYIGSIIPESSEVVNVMKKNKIAFTTKELSDFIVICNYMKITNMEPNAPKVFAKSYEEAKQIFNSL